MYMNRSGTTLIPLFYVYCFFQQDQIVTEAPSRDVYIEFCYHVAHIYPLCIDIINLFYQHGFQ